MQTTMTGTRCGNHGKVRVYHADSAAVRACYAESRQPVSAPPATAPSQAPRNADEARTAAAVRLANQTSPFVTTRSYPASDRQISFYTDLVREVLTGDVQKVALDRIDTLSAADAKRLISDMMVMRDSQRAMKAAAKTTAEPAPGAPGWRKLAARVMGTMTEANFAIEDEDGKTRFYRVSKRGARSRRPGTWKIQERVTDMLLPRSDALMAKVLPAILAMGVEASGKMFFERMHACYKCGASLTDDTGNPYYEMGLGPECGSK